jgi:hypothetical protein
MKATNMNVSYYKTPESILAAVDAIEANYANYNIESKMVGADMELKETAKKKLKALWLKLDAMDLPY